MDVRWMNSRQLIPLSHETSKVIFVTETDKYIKERIIKYEIGISLRNKLLQEKSREFHQ